VVWDRIRSIVPTWRAAFKNPMVFMNIEEACRRLDAWREKTRSGFRRGHAPDDAAGPAKKLSRRPASPFHCSTHDQRAGTLSFAKLDI